MRFADMDGLRALAVEHKLALIEDCAHAHGGAWKGRGAGSLGDIGCFSFQESKLMTAGEGGFVMTSELRYHEAMQTIINCGRASLTDEYGTRMLGSNYRMTELQACLLVGQLEMLPALRARRTAHAALLGELLGKIDGVGPAPARDLFVAALEAEGIPCDGRFYEPVYKSDLFYATPENCPQLSGDYSRVRWPA